MSAFALVGSNLWSLLSRAGAYGARFVVANPRLAISVAGPEMATYLVRTQLRRLFPNARGLDFTLNVISSFAPVATALGPVFLVSPEAALALGASYLLLITIREGTVLLVKFTTESSYNTLRSLFARNSIPDVEMEELDTEGWVVVEDEVEQLMNEFELIEGPTAEAIVEELQAVSCAQPMNDMQIQDLTTSMAFPPSTPVPPPAPSPSPALSLSPISLTSPPETVSVSPEEAVSSEAAIKSSAAKDEAV